jgi:hypothetical protein
MNAREIEIFGRYAGHLVTDGDRFVFHAADRTFWELDRRSFEGVADAEKAVHLAWARRMHRAASPRSQHTDRVKRK